MEIDFDLFIEKRKCGSMMMMMMMIFRNPKTTFPRLTCLSTLFLFGIFLTWNQLFEPTRMCQICKSELILFFNEFLRICFS